SHACVFGPRRLNSAPAGGSDDTQISAPACIVAPHSMEVPMRTRSRVIGGVLAVSLFTQLAACGTLFYPDRRGQIDGKIDPAIAALNAVGLLFYIIPGLI